jgi:hypothetical protein
MIIQTIGLDPSRAVWTESASNLSSLDPSGAIQIDAEHPTRNRKVVGFQSDLGLQTAATSPTASWRLWSTPEPSLSPQRGAERHTQPVMGGIAWMDPAAHPAHGPTGTGPTEGIVMRHALITIRLLDQAREGAIAQAEADERLEHQGQGKLRAKPAEPGQVVALVRRVRALVARTT